MIANIGVVGNIGVPVLTIVLMLLAFWIEERQQ